MKKNNLLPGVNHILVYPILNISNPQGIMLAAPFGIKVLILGKVIATGTNVPEIEHSYILFNAHLDTNIKEVGAYTVHKEDVLGFSTEYFGYKAGWLNTIEVDPVAIVIKKGIQNLKEMNRHTSIYVKILSGKLQGQVGVCHIRSLISNNFYEKTVHIIEQSDIAGLVELKKNETTIPLEFYERQKAEWLLLGSPDTNYH